MILPGTLGISWGTRETGNHQMKSASQHMDGWQGLPTGDCTCHNEDSPSGSAHSPVASLHWVADPGGNNNKYFI
jgi:hypothetical protein